MRFYEISHAVSCKFFPLSSFSCSPGLSVVPWSLKKGKDLLQPEVAAVADGMPLSLPQAVGHWLTTVRLRYVQNTPSGKLKTV